MSSLRGCVGLRAPKQSSSGLDWFPSELLRGHAIAIASALVRNDVEVKVVYNYLFSIFFWGYTAECGVFI